MTDARHWATRANCCNENPETFYIEEPAIIEHAKLVCRDCPVQLECFNDAAANEDWYGIRAGLIGPTRKRIAQGKTTASHTPATSHRGTVRRLTDDGWTAEAIAGYLNISKRTVERIRAHLTRTDKANA